MRPLVTLTLAGLVLATLWGVSHARAEDPAREVAGYRGKNRVLLVFAASARDPIYLAQRRLWEKEQNGFTDRNLVVLPLFATARRTVPLAGKYAVRPGMFTVLLIGKDGNEAFRSEHPVPPGDLYSRIDAMPMRREEMRRQAAGR